MKGKKWTYTATMTGSFKKMKETPAPEELVLKEGALIMFNKNDKNKQWVNGNTGIITECYPNSIVVRLTNTGKDVLYLRMFGNS